MKRFPQVFLEKSKDNIVSTLCVWSRRP